MKWNDMFEVMLGFAVGLAFFLYVFDVWLA